MKWFMTVCCAAVLVGASGVSVAAGPPSGGYKGALYDTEKDPSYSKPYGKLTFKVSGTKLQNFNLRGVTAFCFSGFSGEFWRAPFRVNIDSIRIRGKSFKKKHVVKTEPHGYKVTTKLTGRFSGKVAKGTIHYLAEYPLCEAKYDWKATKKG